MRYLSKNTFRNGFIIGLGYPIGEAATSYVITYLLSIPIPTLSIKLGSNTSLMALLAIFATIDIIRNVFEGYHVNMPQTAGYLIGVCVSIVIFGASLSVFYPQIVVAVEGVVIAILFGIGSRFMALWIIGERNSYR